MKTNNISRYPIDLHCHTTRSDGGDSPWELVDHAAKAGMKIIAITDHDIRPMGKDIMEYAAKKSLTVLPGMEVSCDTYVEDCHIVCLGCDWEDDYFYKLEKDVAAARIESYRELVNRLNEKGMFITWEEVLENGGNAVPEEIVQKKMIFELMARKGYTSDWIEAKLLVKNTPEFQILRRKPDPCEVIANVHRTGGIAIMAHPYLVAETVCLNGQNREREEYIEYLLAAGLDGIEACYSYAKTSYGGSMPAEEIEQHVKRVYKDRVAVISGGSDYHADAKKGAKKIRELGECGLTMEEFMENPILRQLLEKVQKIVYTE